MGKKKSEPAQLAFDSWIREYMDMDQMTEDIGAKPEDFFEEPVSCQELYDVYEIAFKAGYAKGAANG